MTVDGEEISKLSKPPVQANEIKMIKTGEMSVRNRHKQRMESSRTEKKRRNSQREQRRRMNERRKSRELMYAV